MQHLFPLCQKEPYQKFLGTPWKKNYLVIHVDLLLRKSRKDFSFTVDKHFDFDSIGKTIISIA